MNYIPPQSHKPTVTIGIPAHNESRNIARHLRSVFGQRQVSFELDRVVVLCDGCTDNTAEIVRSLRTECLKLSVEDDGYRLGQAERMSRLFRACRSDIIIRFDADTVLGSDTVIERIVRRFEPGVGLVGGRDMPAEPKNRLSRAIATLLEVWYEARRAVNGGDSVHNHAGCVSAVSREFYRNVRIPPDIVADDEFLYFEAKRQGFKFRFAEDAPVLYRTAATFPDYLAQSSRFMDNKFKILGHFGPEAAAGYEVPLRAKARALLKVAARKPLQVVAAAALQLIAQAYRYLHPGKHTQPLWVPAQSTK